MTVLRVLAVTILLPLATPGSAEAQIGGLIKKAKEAVKEVSRKDTAKTAPRPDSARAASPASSPTATTQAAAPETTTRTKPDPKVWDNYDFIPGSKVLFFTDFSDDRVGNFARGLKYVSGPVEVVERDDVKVLRATGTARFLIPLPRVLPQRFTLELDVIAPATGALARTVSFEGGSRWEGSDQSANVTWNPRGAWYEGSGANMATSGSNVPEAMQPAMTGQVVHLRMLMDSTYLKLYVNERRLHNVPVFAFRRDSAIWVSLGGEEADGMAVFVTSIRVSESETDVMYDALAAKGRWVTQGILFETGKAELRPESRPVLKEIAGTMKKYADLSILIEGHTDNVGAAASNLALSDQRAAAVKAALVADFGIGADRIATQGLGDTKPSAPNTSALGRAQNRRVEIVKR